MSSRRIASLAGFAIGVIGNAGYAEEHPYTLELENINVNSDYQYETATSPVQGYRATRSATATKTDTAIRDIPQSISVVPASVLKDLGSNSVERALEFAGGVSKQNNFGGLTLYEYSIRGFTTSEFYKDGFSANRGYPTTPDAANIERIEVLKGPAASLYGRGDPGGTVNIVTKKPQRDAFTTLQTSAGSWDRYRTALDVNAPLDEEGKLLSRVNLAVEDNNSFRDHVESKRVFVAPSFSWQLNPETSLLVETEFVRHTSTFDRGVVAPNNKWSGVSRSTFLGEPDDDIDNDNNRVQFALDHQLNDVWSLRLASHYKQGEMSGFASEARPLNADGRTVNRRYRERDNNWHDSITQLELRGQFDAVGLQHDVLIGTEYENYRKNERVTTIAGGPYAIDIYSPVYGQPKPDGARSGTDFYEHIESRALNLQDQIVFTDKLRGMIGARYEHFDQQIDDFTTNATSGQRQDAFTQRAGLLYQLTPQVGLFANASTSFKPNNGLDAAGKTFDPEEGVGYEIGIKSELFDDRLSTTLAAFHIEKENVLALDPGTDTNRAMGKARSQGLDLQLTGQVSEAIRVIGAFAYIDAEVTKGDRTIPAGSRILGVAEHSGSLLSVYEFQEGVLRGSDVGAAYTYVGDRSGQSGTDFELPAYQTVDLLAHYKVSDNVTVGLNLNNIFDEKYYERSYSNYWVAPGEPRNFTVSLTLGL
ncbi:TonB-dependent siderophore receptor [Pseudomonas syringae pv. tagetis]|uniref:Metal-pseudopaline receptor CntO n=1 Tax=Pseudomonas syringae pv. tagetis TaxID=129140 RepID=A0A0Q0EJF6_9PSED|nr:TonB-dependent siderophore receptor [Pseudomonas syringae group genomosp. 7]KPY86507.1 putative TonB-dependent siderophore receptor [Pseudomonas syringae pv. tagetis]RMW13688.1 putative TonB-dependent siderophore receptor [Pseudomonas syringae pv. tagetis]RMW23591.1 putative TonB-dependent siderophore receptor [Pseudomonas syringae pv. tagetis]UNB70837.1 TonB-dependent siderophore receptor [Pseudomonas syringae pv. tagetis]